MGGKVCFITSSKLSRQKFEFILKVKVMGSNPGYLLKSFLRKKGRQIEIIMILQKEFHPIIEVHFCTPLPITQTLRVVDCNIYQHSSQLGWLLSPVFFSPHKRDMKQSSRPTCTHWSEIISTAALIITWDAGSLCQVRHSGYLGRMQGLAENSKSICEICDSKSEKSAPQVYLQGTSLCYTAFVLIVGLTNLAQLTLCNVNF